MLPRNQPSWQRCTGGGHLPKVGGNFLLHRHCSLSGGVVPCLILCLPNFPCHHCCWRPLPVCGCDRPFHWIERAVSWFGKVDIIRNFLNEGCLSLETFAPAKLCLDQHGVEKGASLAEDCPRNLAAHVSCEIVPDDVDFLLI
jgi:hypothetical protein